MKNDKESNTNVKKIALGLVLVAVIGGVGLSYFNKNYLYNGKIAKNIFIEGINISDMSKEEAITKVENKYTPKEIELSYEDNKYKISPDSINLEYNVENLVNEAYKYTKTDSYFTNIKRYFELNNSPKKMTIEPSYEETKLNEEIQKVSTDINIEMKNANIWVSNSGGISASEAIVGKTFDEESNKSTIEENIANMDQEVIALNVNETQPEITTEQAKSVNTLLAQYTTKFSANNPGRNHNIRVSANKSSDIVLMPGEEFSYNTETGMRTAANGYQNAPVIVNQELVDALGGGVCQVSSTLYNSVLFSGLQLTSISNHSIASDYVPMGQDAMVNDVGTDFKFKNPYNHPIYIKNIVGSNYVTSKIYGSSEDKKNITLKVDHFKVNGLDATKTYREYRDGNGNLLSSEYIKQSVYKKLKN